MALHLVPAETQPEEKVGRAKKASKPPDMLQCPRCGGREVIETVIGAMIQARKLKGGTRQIVCFSCILKGERVVLG